MDEKKYSKTKWVYPFSKLFTPSNIKFHICKTEMYQNKCY